MKEKIIIHKEDGTVEEILVDSSEPIDWFSLRKSFFTDETFTSIRLLINKKADIGTIYIENIKQLTSEVEVNVNIFIAQWNAMIDSIPEANELITSEVVSQWQEYCDLANTSIKVLANGKLELIIVS